MGVFEHYESFYQPKKSAWVRGAVAVSVIAHVGFAAALVINAAWKLNKLQLQDAEIALASFGLPQAAPPALSGEKQEKKRKPIRKTKEIAQTKDATENRETPTTGGDGAGSPDGDPDGVGDSQGNTPGAIPGVLCTGSNCVPLNIEPPEPPKKPKQTKRVPHNLIKGNLISGQTQIHPDTASTNAINRSGKDRVVGTVEACISTTGRVTSAKIKNSTGYSRYDAKLLAGVRRWIYRPYKVGGTKIRVCTWINFIYKVHK